MQSLEQEVGSWDSVLLENLSEDNFISNLHQRYKRDHIYTYIGTFLISINPYKPLLLYTPDLVRTYANKSLFQLPPHIYAVTNSAYQWLENYNEDQCIILSGESGSGKTETSRMCVHFLTQVSEIRKEPKLVRQRSSNLLISSKVGSQPNSRTATPKHIPSTGIGSSTVERGGCLVIKSSTGTVGGGGNSLKKCSHEKTVEFDFSHHNSIENLSKCQKHNSISSNLNNTTQFSNLVHSQSVPCSKHNNNNNIKFEKTLSNASSSSALRASISSTKCNSCHHHHFNHNQEFNNINKISEQHLLTCNKTLKKNNLLNNPTTSKYCNLNTDCNCDHNINSTIINTTTTTTITNNTPIIVATTATSTSAPIQLSKSATSEIKRTPILTKKCSNSIGLATTTSVNTTIKPTTSNSSLFSTNTMGSISCKQQQKDQDNMDLFKIREKISQADILLEALGNATTIKNSNSSRFGKFFDIEFDFKGDPISGHITQYMLEKSRVTQKNVGERNFHIFYQLLSGAEIQFLKSLKLQRNVDKYNLLRNGVPTDNDKKNFIFTKKSLEILGFSQDEILSMFKIIAVVLKLGNLIFIPSVNIDGTETCVISNEYELHEIAHLLNIDYQILINCLTRGDVNWNQLDTGPELDAGSASRIRKILCRTLYGRLFTWAVNRINDAMKIKDQYTRGRNLGILDFYGFEILEKNSFEQLAINYCNERLHQNFLQNVLKFQQDLYLREGLEWTRIDYFDNEAICELIDKTNYGIMSLLDEPQVTCDETFFTRIYQCCSGNPNFLSQDSNRELKSFKIRHYAGQVTYSVVNFIEKNLDILPKNISSGLYKSKLMIVQTLFPEGNPKRGIKKPTSLGSNLRTSLSTLISTLNNRRNHFVFCIKPNELKQQRFFELALVQHQIRYMNLMPLVNLWRTGHYFHIMHLKFFNRYKILSNLTWPHLNKGTIIEGIAIIIRSIPLPIAEFTIGRSHVFIRSPRTVFELEDFRKSRLDYLATFIQKTFRCYSKRKLFLDMKKSQIIISSAWRTWRECRFGIPFKGRRHLWGMYRVAREEYRIMRYREQVDWAVGVIHRQYIQWKRRQFLLTLPLRLPTDSMSPLCFEWPVAPRYLTETSQLLRNIYHRWRCYKYRKSFDQTSRNRMREKVTASIIFRDRKASYIKSVSHPFLGDYVRLRQNVQWKKISLENNDQYVVFADIINKIARSSGKFVPILLVLSTSSMLLLDQRTLQVKYRVPATEIYRLSLSPYLDDIAVFHVKAEKPTSNHISSSDSPTGCLFQSELGKKKGDFVFQTGHVIEIVTKLFLVVQNATAKPPEVHISTEFEANFGQQTVLFTFKCSGLAEVQHGQPKITRKPNRMEVIV